MRGRPQDALPIRPEKQYGGGGGDATARLYYHNGSAMRVNTDLVLADSLRKQYPTMHLTVVPSYMNDGTPCDLMGYAAVTGLATVVPIPKNEGGTETHSWKQFLSPARRMEGQGGAVVDSIVFGKFLYTWKGNEFILYMASCRDGTEPYPSLENQYLLGPGDEVVDELVRTVCMDAVRLHEEIWIFDQGWWQKSAELYHSVAKSSWEDVILDEGMKKTIQDDVLQFFAAKEKYSKLRVPWKRGVIYYGPPGNGKTISIKAMMNTLYHLKDPIPTLYVKSLTSFGGPERSVKDIFNKARATAPCYLVFEDLDSIVTDFVRSYFLNEVDGLQSNDGVFMIGSTNHLERLDPGISKRPSRFDRKYEFKKPNLKERTQYCEYWRAKLADNEEVEFPVELSKAIAEITDDFSFAFMQEAFIATLLAIAVSGEETVPGARDYEDLMFWKEMQKQVKILREQM